MELSRKRQLAPEMDRNDAGECEMRRLKLQAPGDQHAASTAFRFSFLVGPEKETAVVGST